MPHQPYRERRVLFPLGVVVGFALTMLVDAILHAALYQPPWRVETPPLHQMTRQAMQRPVSIPRDYFQAPGP
jgi:hypothetical protein